MIGQYVFDFGDGTPIVSTPKPVINLAYDAKGSHPVTLTVTDKHCMQAEASLTQRIADPNQ